MWELPPSTQEWWWQWRAWRQGGSPGRSGEGSRAGTLVHPRTARQPFEKQNEWYRESRNVHHTSFSINCDVSWFWNKCWKAGSGVSVCKEVAAEKQISSKTKSPGNVHYIIFYQPLFLFVKRLHISLRTKRQGNDLYIILCQQCPVFWLKLNVGKQRDQEKDTYIWTQPNYL